MSQHANALQRKPAATCSTKQEEWSPCIATLLGHTSFVNVVACTPDGSKARTSLTLLFYVYLFYVRYLQPPNLYGTRLL